VLTDPLSPWKIVGVEFFDDDDEMLAKDYDGIILAADPISVIHPSLFRNTKSFTLARNNVTIPILWERPLGFLAQHPEEIVQTVPSDAQSVISFARYGLPTKIAKTIISTGSLGHVTDFEIYATLNCGLQTKIWRQLGAMGVTQPVHFLDNAFEQIDIMGLGPIESISTQRHDATREGISFDEKWEISVTLTSGLTGRIIGLQYVGTNEFLYPLRSLKVVGTKGALVSALGSTHLIDSLGNSNTLTLPTLGVDPRIVQASYSLEKFFREIDGYPKAFPCRGEALSLAECLRTWIDSLGSSRALSEYNLTSPAEVVRYLALAAASLESADKQHPISVSHLYS
jgi:predicted dehydrogenase